MLDQLSHTSLFSCIRALCYFSVLGLLMGCDSAQSKQNPQQQPINKTSSVTEHKSKSPQNKKKKKKTHYVEVVSIVKKTIPFIIKAQGNSYFKNKVKIFNQTKATLISPNFEIGQSVKLGELLATLDDTQLKFAFKKSQVSLKQKQVDLIRLKKLSSSQLVSNDDLSQAQTDVELARLELNTHKTNLSYSKIFSPLSGVLAEVMVKPGDVLPTHSHLMTIYDNSQMHIKFSVAESLISQIKIHDLIEVNFPAFDNNNLTATISSIYPTADPISHFVTYTAVLSSMPPQSLSGLSVSVTHQSQGNSYLLTPISSVRQEQLIENTTQSNKINHYVFIYDPETQMTIKTNIKVGKILTYNQLNYYETLSGLSSGDQVVVKGIFNLKHKQKVKLSSSNNISSTVVSTNTEPNTIRKNHE